MKLVLSMTLLLSVMIVIGAFATARAQSDPAAQTTNTKEWLFFLEPARDDFFESGATEQEERTIGEHFKYLQRLLAEGKLILAGRCQDGAPGIVVVEAPDEAAAKQLLAGDPAIHAGVFKGKLRPFRTALLRGRE